MDSPRLTLESSAVFREVLDHLPTAVYFVDVDERIRFWNHGAEKITGYLRQDVIGRFRRENIFAGFSPDDSAASPFVKALQDGKVSEAEMYLHHRDGYRIPVRMRSFPIRNDKGSVIGIAETFDGAIGNTDWDRRLNRLSRYGALDETTGVLSSSVMQTQLKESLEMFEKHRLPLSILLIEIQQFEQLISRFGPLVVPASLRSTAQTIESFIRPSDFIGRWDDYRLLVILTECSPFELPAVLNKLRLRANATDLRWWGDNLSLALSFGGAAAQHDDTATALLSRAKKVLEGSPVIINGNSGAPDASTEAHGA